MKKTKPVSIYTLFHIECNVTDSPTSLWTGLIKGVTHIHVSLFTAVSFIYIQVSGISAFNTKPRCKHLFSTYSAMEVAERLFDLYIGA